MRLVAIALVVCTWTVALAQPVAPVHRAVALLPLDADAKLELYGQPVANEIAHAMVQAGLEVVLVGPKMAVPETARLVVDGTIKAGKGDIVTISVRVRDSRDGTVYDTLVVPAATVTAMDRAQQELSGKVVPAVKARLATLLEQDRAAQQPKPLDDPKRAVTPVAKLAPMLTAIYASPGASLGAVALRAALAHEVSSWASHRHHEVRELQATELGGKAAPKTVAAQQAELSIEIDVLDLDVVVETVPLATARVHVRIADPRSVVFDRVIVTDTIVGEKNMDKLELAARVAREVLAIADPQLKRRISTWF
ncbi:MAG: hypothetical protein ABI678_26825 [Kofleriaceae bacterium]